MPHFSLTMTVFPVKFSKNGLGLTGTVAIGGDELVARPSVGGGDEGDGDGEEEEERLPWGVGAQARLGFYGKGD